MNHRIFSMIEPSCKPSTARSDICVCVFVCPIPAQGKPWINICLLLETNKSNCRHKATGIHVSLILLLTEQLDKIEGRTGQCLTLWFYCVPKSQNSQNSLYLTYLIFYQESLFSSTKTQLIIQIITPGRFNSTWASPHPPVKIQTMYWMTLRKPLWFWP